MLCGVFRAVFLKFQQQWPGEELFESFEDGGGSCAVHDAMVIGESDAGASEFVEWSPGEAGCVYGGWELNFGVATCECGEEAGPESSGTTAGTDIKVPPPDGSSQWEWESGELQGAAKFAAWVLLLELVDLLLDLQQREFFGLVYAAPEEPGFAVKFSLDGQNGDGMGVLVDVGERPAEPCLSEFREIVCGETSGFEKQCGPGDALSGSESGGGGLGERHAAIVCAERYGFVEPEEIPGESSAGGDCKTTTISIFAHFRIALRMSRSVLCGIAVWKEKKINRGLICSRFSALPAGMYRRCPVRSTRRTCAVAAGGRQNQPVAAVDWLGAGNSCRIASILLQKANRCVLFQRTGDGTPVCSDADSRTCGAVMSRLGLGLACLVLLIIPVVFVTAWMLEPDPSGMGTHQQLGFPPCVFLKVTGTVCPQCGLTTSFALLVRGRLEAALWANPAGPVLAVLLAAVWPWLLVSAFFRRWMIFREPGEMLLKLVLGWFLLTLIQWVPRLL